jgi:predicted dehydrogenase
MGGTHFGNPATMPPPAAAIPDGLAWDLWLGPTAKREFYRDYLPLKWRAFYDFGSGMLGDFGCHTLDTPVWALDLGPPLIREERLAAIPPLNKRVIFTAVATLARGNNVAGLIWTASGKRQYMVNAHLMS